MTWKPLTPDQLHDLALTSVENLATSHLQLGNCLLAVERSRAFAEFGCSCMKHYASMIGVGERLAREVRRVARSLEVLSAQTASRSPSPSMSQRTDSPRSARSWPSRSLDSMGTSSSC